jgi:hypothetical protein
VGGDGETAARVKGRRANALELHLENLRVESVEVVALAARAQSCCARSGAALAMEIATVGQSSVKFHSPDVFVLY